MGSSWLLFLIVLISTLNKTCFTAMNLGLKTANEKKPFFGVYTYRAIKELSKVLNTNAWKS